MISEDVRCLERGDLALFHNVTDFKIIKLSVTVMTTDHLKTAVVPSLETS
jgi:hypothetical protein